VSAGNDFGSFSVNQNVAIKANVFFYIFYTGGGASAPLLKITVNIRSTSVDVYHVSNHTSS